MNRWYQLITCIHIHPFFWLVVAAAIITARFYELFIVFFIVWIHELGHAVAAHFFSWRIKNIFLLPFGGVLEVDEHGNRPLKEELIVTIMGPLQHLWMITLAIFLYRMELITMQDYSLFIEYNVMILLFNCLPILPLDGGKLMYLLFTTQYPLMLALNRSIILSIFFLGLYCFGIIMIMPLHLNGWIVAVFLAISLYYEWRNRPYVFMRFLIERYSEKEQKPLHTKKIYVNINDSLQSVIEKFQRNMNHFVIVIDNGEELAKFDEKKIIKRYFERSKMAYTMRDLLY